MSEAFYQESKNIAELPPLDFKDLNLEVPTLATAEEPHITQTDNIEVKFNGVRLNLEIEYSSDFAGEDIGLSSSIYIKVFRNGGVAAEVALWALQTGDGMPEVSTGVNNFDRGLKGLGRALWEVFLRAMQDMAEKWDTPVMHVVHKMPSPSLGPKKWDELFLPLLEKYGYEQQDKPDYWEKIYYPKSN